MQDNFEIQKNFALDATTQEWRLLIDADEQYEHLFWNQLPWHIVQAEVNASNCVSVPRINIVDGLTWASRNTEKAKKKTVEGQKYVSKNYSLEAICEKWKKIIINLI